MNTGPSREWWEERIADVQSRMSTAVVNVLTSALRDWDAEQSQAAEAKRWWNCWAAIVRRHGSNFSREWDSATDCEKESFAELLSELRAEWQATSKES